MSGSGEKPAGDAFSRALAAPVEISPAANSTQVA